MSSPTPRITVKPWITPARTLKPSPTPDTSFARRIVGRLDELATLFLGTDGEATAQWALDEGAWVNTNMEGLVADGSEGTLYVTNILDVMSAVANGADQATAITALLAMRDGFAASAGMPPPAPTATPAPTPVAHKVGDRVVFTETDDGINALWLTIVSVVG